jgi:hypothetical protein
MKTSLANIGEGDLSAEALKLERAGRDRDAAVIFAETPAFLSALRLLLEKIRLTQEENTESAMSEEEAEFLRGKLLEIKLACENYDKKTAKTVLTELKNKQWPENVTELLDKISAYLLHSEFEKAAEAAFFDSADSRQEKETQPKE